MPSEPVKICVACGREIHWRKKWERSWADVKYCSTACRRHGVTDVDRQLEQALRQALTHRSGPVPLTDVERALTVEHPERDLREPLRRAARRLAAAGEAEIVQGTRVVDPSTARGPLSIRRAARVS